MITQYDEKIKELLEIAANEKHALSVRLDMIREIGRIGNAQAIDLLCIFSRYEINQEILAEVQKSIRLIYRGINAKQSFLNFIDPEEPMSSIVVCDDNINTKRKNKLEIELMAMLAIMMFCLVAMVGILIIIVWSFQIYPFLAWSFLLITATVAIIKLIRNIKNQTNKRQ